MLTQNIIFFIKFYKSMIEKKYPKKYQKILLMENGKKYHKKAPKILQKVRWKKVPEIFMQIKKGKSTIKSIGKLYEK